MAEVRVSRFTSNDQDETRVYEFTIQHRATKRKWSVRVTGEEFAFILTGMSGVFGEFEERDYRKEAK